MKCTRRLNFIELKSRYDQLGLIIGRRCRAVASLAGGAARRGASGRRQRVGAARCRLAVRPHAAAARRGTAQSRDGHHAALRCPQGPA